MSSSYDPTGATDAHAATCGALLVQYAFSTRAMFRSLRPSSLSSRMRCCASGEQQGGRLGHLRKLELAASELTAHKEKAERAATSGPPSGLARTK